MNKALSTDFYLNRDVVSVARDLLGKFLLVASEHGSCKAMITETEAYAGPWDKASHAYGGRRTKRTEVMFHAGGVAYVYLCYGMHVLFNVVCGPEDLPHAVLIRAVEPVSGVPLMKARRGITQDKNLCNGPGKLSQAMGIALRHNGISLLGPEIRIEEGSSVMDHDIISTKRIGINYAEEHVHLPWRFYMRPKEHSSKR